MAAFLFRGFNRVAIGGAYRIKVIGCHSLVGEVGVLFGDGQTMLPTI